MSERTEVGRLAFRVEGEWWNAYYAMPNTMTGALHLGSIKMGAATANKEIKAAFMDVMRLVVADILEGATGGDVSWSGERTAPEHERAGRS